MLVVTSPMNMILSFSFLYKLYQSNKYMGFFSRNLKRMLINLDQVKTSPVLNLCVSGAVFVPKMDKLPYIKNM